MLCLWILPVGSRDRAHGSHDRPPILKEKRSGAIVILRLKSFLFDPHPWVHVLLLYGIIFFGIIKLAILTVILPHYRLLKCLTSPSFRGLRPLDPHFRGLQGHPADHWTPRRPGSAFTFGLMLLLSRSFLLH